MLLTAGAQDLATPSNQAQQMYRALAERDVPAAFALYPEEGHGVEAPLALADVCARTVVWFERFMPVTHDERAARPPAMPYRGFSQARQDRGRFPEGLVYLLNSMPPYVSEGGPP